MREDGTLWAWGANFYGQFGNGTSRNGTNSPQPILTNVTWKAVAAGRDHTIALREDGTLWTWGGNGNGQLGNGQGATDASRPQPIQTNVTWKAVAAGEGHTVALREDGSLWAWGRNFSGQLGNGTNGSFESENIPQSIMTGEVWKDVAAGRDHSVALREDGTLWAWGANGSGQLGNSTLMDANTPQPIQTNVTWKAIVAGNSYTVALREDGTLWAWGNNNNGQLGNGTFISTNSPQMIQTNLTWKAVSAGGSHTVALREDGSLWTWGSNGDGQLGDATFISTNSPQPVQTSMRWQAVAAGGSRTVALREDGTLWAWGRNDSGQLGNGTETRFSNNPQPIQSNTTWKAVAAGFYHTAALGEDGSLWTWGFNVFGQLGNGTFVSANSPQPIQTNVTWKAVAAGNYHTVALREDGTLWVWGRNNYGQLGDGTFTSANSPQPVQANVTWQAIATAFNHTAALREDGTLWTWGNNDYGQLGNGTSRFDVGVNTPQPIQTNITWQAVSAGDGHTVALREDGTLWTWGFNWDGQLGNGAPWFIDGPKAPQPIQTNVTWKAIAAGFRYTAALRADGTLWAWGNNFYGQFGNGTSMNGTNSPQPILTNVTWKAVSASSSHTIALREDGTLWAWGANGSGQLGNSTLMNANTPQPILTNVTWKAIVAGYS